MKRSPINRRAFVTTGALALAGGALGVQPAIGQESVVATRPLGKLGKVDIAANRIIRQVAGLRPFRPSGFVVRAEQRGDKTIIHNYGHGGCGITLSWGTAKMALDLALATPHRTAAVIGAGVIGLTTARLLQDHGFDVAVYAKALPPDTTSNVAAGVFGVTSIADTDKLEGPFRARLQEAARFAHRYFQPFVGQSYGVKWIDFFLLGDERPEQPPDFAPTPELYPLTVHEPGQHPFPTRYAASFPTLFAETNVFMPRLLDEVIGRGAAVKVRAFASVEDIGGLAEPLVFNCTGLGAKTLFGDAELTPVKGQLTLLLPQQTVDYCYLDGARDLYMFPRSDGIVLGGSHQHDVWSTEPDPEIARAIFDGHREIIDGMG